MISHSKPFITEENIDFVKARMLTGMLTEGEYCEKFRSALGAYYQCKNVILTNSGSSALFLALKALNLSKKKVLLPTYVCKDVIDSVLSAELIPVLCDVNAYWNLSDESIGDLAKEECGAIIVPHNLGICADVGKLKKKDIPIIEDCCQCFGGYFNGKLAGTFGDISVLSFNATKCLTTGEGGAILINNSAHLKTLEKLKGFEHMFRMSDLQAALGFSQLSQYGDMLKKRQKLAAIYFDLIHSDLVDQFKKVKQQTMFFRFLLYSDIDFDNFSAFMRSNGVSVKKGIDDLLHRQYNLGTDVEFSNAVDCFNHTISIPIYPSLSETEAKQIAKLVNEYYSAN